MQCTEIRKKINAWLDGELPSGEAELVAAHVAGCRNCRVEADSLKQIMISLDSLPAIRISPAQSGRMVRRFRKISEKQKISEWWQNLSLSLRGAACGAALAGLLFGAVLGVRLTATIIDTQTQSYANFYAGQEYLP